MAFSSVPYSLTLPILCLAICSLSLTCSAFTSQDYNDALGKSILFFEGQRSGKLPPDQRLKWRADSGLSDGSSSYVDLVGGYYDAGDNVKFGLPMAFTTTLLAWSVIEFGSSMQNQIQNARSAIRWSANYLLKLPPPPWHLIRPRSDVAAETAAALAATSIVFHDSDPSYSTKLLQTAMKVFDFADKYRGSYSDSLNSVVCPFIALTQDTIPMATHWVPMMMTTLSVGMTKRGTRFFFQGGLLYKGSESNLQYVTSSAFLLLTYAKYLSSNGGVASCGSSTVTAQKLISQARTRGSSIPSVNAHPDHIGCDSGFQYLHSGSPNQMSLLEPSWGSDSNDNFADDRNNYQQSEPATYINAPFVGAVAFFSAKSTPT
ncbi:Endoglucanase 4 [Camellia lanceoleosa]|uniref:Endoglucanase 4 n=1 Tax=Camellia lanceoleosa TaxID=1840588 RepID=A0ACC0G0Z6_9ERIC|nr:Endoglucanase 4 [Camellia lanceoleosa]